MLFGLDTVVALLLVGLGLRTRVGRRLRDLVRMKMGRLLDRVENPVDALDLSYQRQWEALQQVRRGVADVVTSEKRLEIQAAQLRQNQERLRDQARRALLGGREDLARLALTRSQTANTQLDDLQAQIGQLKDQEAKLQATAEKIRARVDSFKTQRDTLKAQYRAAEASARVGETMAGISKDMGDVTLMLDRARDRTTQMQARAAAIDQLVNTGALGTISGPGEDDIDRQLRAIAGPASVEQQLEAMRQELLSSPGEPARIPAPEADPSGQVQ